MKEKIMGICSCLSPLLAVVLVAGCVVISLSGYEEPTYADESGDASSDAEEIISVSTEEDTSGDAIQGDFDLEDGIYVGTATGYSGEITVAVTIQDGSIIDITVVSHSDGEAYMLLAQGVIDSILSTQSLDVDAVSGATYSSNGIINAVKNALYGEEDTGETGESQTGTAVSGSTASVSAVDDSDAEYEDGTYYGTATGFSGDITVKVVIKNGKIKSITLTDYVDDAEYINMAKAVITSIISGQTTNVDTVSGATYSSAGIINAVRNALSQASTSSSGSSSSSSSSGGSSSSKSGSSSSGSSSSGSTATVSTVDDSDAEYEDGTYYGTATGFSGDITVKVVIKNGKIKSITLTDYVDDAEYISMAKAVITSIISGQTTNVDTVSGATYSSAGIINAVRDALSQAVTTSSSSGGTSSSDGSSSSGSSSSTDSSSSSGSTAVTGTIPYTDGIYYGTAEGWGGDITVAVVIQDKTILAILVISADEETEPFITNAKAVLTSIIEQQSTDVDTVSGATFSSNGLINAVIEALADAERVTNGGEAQNNPYASSTGSSSDDNSADDETTDNNSTDDSASDDGTTDDSATDDSTTDDSSSDDSATDDSTTDTGTTDDGTTDEGSADSDSTDDDSEDGDDSETDTGVFTDGSYDVTKVWVYPDDNLDFNSYYMTVTFTFENDVITAVTAVQQNGTTGQKNTNKSYISDALNGWGNYTGLITQITSLTTEQLSAGDYTLDTVSGATCSSEAIIGAVQSAADAAAK